MVRSACARLPVPLAVLALAGCGASGECPEHFDTAAWRQAQRPGSDQDRVTLARQVVRCRYVKPGDSKRRVAQVLGRARRDELQSKDEYAREWDYYLQFTDPRSDPDTINRCLSRSATGV